MKDLEGSETFKLTLSTLPECALAANSDHHSLYTNVRHSNKPIEHEDTPIPMHFPEIKSVSGHHVHLKINKACKPAKVTTITRNSPNTGVAYNTSCSTCIATV